MGAQRRHSDWARPGMPHSCEACVEFSLLCPDFICERSRLKSPTAVQGTAGAWPGQASLDPTASFLWKTPPGIGSGGNDREDAMLLAGRPDGDLHVLTQNGEEFHEASDGKVARAVAHQQGDLRLLHPENFGDLNLSHATTLEDRVDLQSELRLEQFLFGIGKAKVCGDVSTAFGYADNSAACFFGFGFHFNSAFLDSSARLPLQGAIHRYTSIHIDVYECRGWLEQIS